MVYQRHCQSCHGSDGKGTRVRQSNPEIPDFTSRTWQESRSDAQLRVSICEGKGEGMPPFTDTLGERQCQELVAFVRSFGPARARPKPEKAGDFEQKYDELQKELERLQREFRRAQETQHNSRG
jgi:mono/diheme cytochrome c family protein